MIAALLICVAAAIASFVAAWLVRRNARRLGVMQTPNARSSHSIPTPGGGGVGIVLGGSLATAYAALAGPWPMLGILVIGVLVAAIGFVDDRTPIPARFRLTAQLALMGAAIWISGTVGALTAQLGWPLPEMVVGAAAVIVAVYWLNLFNFMDGIDGIAGSEAVFLLLAAALLAALHTPGATETTLWWVLLGLAAACLGFLALNWPPAKIFMGDAGSTYLGLMTAVLALLTISAGWLSLAQWVILTAAFVVDATVTLVRRLLLRERVFEAHRRHAYQVLSRRLGSHRPVTLGYIGVDVLWLLPLAYLAGNAGWALPAIAAAYLPLIGLALMFGAGAPEVAVRPK